MPILNLFAKSSHQILGKIRKGFKFLVTFLIYKLVMDKEPEMVLRGNFEQPLIKQQKFSNIKTIWVFQQIWQCCFNLANRLIRRTTSDQHWNNVIYISIGNYNFELENVDSTWFNVVICKYINVGNYNVAKHRVKVVYFRNSIVKYDKNVSCMTIR